MSHSGKSWSVCGYANPVFEQEPMMFGADTLLLYGKVSPLANFMPGGAWCEVEQWDHLVCFVTPFSEPPRMSFQMTSLGELVHDAATSVRLDYLDEYKFLFSVDPRKWATVKALRLSWLAIGRS